MLAFVSQTLYARSHTLAVANTFALAHPVEDFSVVFVLVLVLDMVVLADIAFDAVAVADVAAVAAVAAVALFVDAVLHLQLHLQNPIPDSWV